QNQLYAPPPLTGPGEIVFDDGGGGVTSDSGSLTIDSSVTLRTGTAGGAVGANNLVNKGSILAQTGKTMIVGGPLTNQGTIHASDGGTIKLTRAWTNTGTISA